MTANSLHSIQLPFEIFLVSSPFWTAPAPAFSLRCSPALFQAQTKRPVTSPSRHLRSSHAFSRRGVTRCAIERPERYDATDWARALRTLPRSVVLRRIRGHIISNTIAASIVCVVYEVLLRYAPDTVHHFNITPLPHTFMTTAMSLLLVLRSNAAYVCMQPLFKSACRIPLRKVIFSSLLSENENVSDIFPFVFLDPRSTREVL